MDDLALARAIHVLSVIHWIGGLGFVTLVVLPDALARIPAETGLAAFEAAERRFSAQVRISVPLVGLSGFWMAYRGEFWNRFAEPQFWWMTAMVALWALFMVMLFVIEPLFEARFTTAARRDPRTALRRLARLHRILLGFSAVTAFGAVAGAHGMVFF